MELAKKFRGQNIDPIDDLFDIGGLAARLGDRVTAAGIEGTASGEYFEYLSASLASLDIHAQRAACLMADYDDLAVELGPTSEQALLARELYAASCFAAASQGVILPPMEPLLAAITPPTEIGGDCGYEADAAGLDHIFGAKYDGYLFVANETTLGIDITAAAKKRSSPNIFTERQMQGPRWDGPKQDEMGKLDRLGAKTPVLADDPVVKGLTPCDILWAGRCKLNPDGTVEKDTARCVLRGDIHSKKYHVDANQRMSPVVRNSSMMCVDAVSAIRRQHMQPYDVTGAYLNGKQKDCEQVLARPPVGFRECDERGV